MKPFISLIVLVLLMIVIYTVNTSTGTSLVSFVLKLATTVMAASWLNKKISSQFMLTSENSRTFLSN